jgi:Protein of unknown function (DUF5661)
MSDVKDTSFFYAHDYTKKWPGLNLSLAKKIGDDIGVDWDLVDLGEFLQGIKEEQEHSGILGGSVTKVLELHDYHTSGKIAVEHLLEVPNYYTLLEELEDRGDEMFPDVDAKKSWVASMRAKHSSDWQLALAA